MFKTNNFVTQMAAEVDGDKDPREILLASFHQTEQLTCLVNRSLDPHTPGGDGSDPAPSSQAEPAPTTGADVRNGESLAASNGSGDGPRTLSVNEAEPRSGEAGPPDANREDAGNKNESTVDKKVLEAGQGPRTESKDFCISIPSGELLAITSKLNAQLHHLMVSVGDTMWLT